MTKINPILRLLIFLLFAYLFILILKPFIPAIILALAFTIIFFPLSDKIRQSTKLSNSISALITVTLTFLFIIIPFVLLIGLVSNEAITFARTTDFESIRSSIGNLNEIKILGQKITVSDIDEKTISAIKSIGNFISEKSLAIVSAIWNSIFLFFVFLLLYYYFLRDAKKLIVNLSSLLPYEKSQQKVLFSSFQEISKTIFYGNLASAAVAGLIAYVGFSLFGFSGPLIWALLAAIMSFIPTAGTLLIYLAGTALLFFTSGWVMGLMMIIYFVVVDLFIRENIIKGKVLEDKLSFHPIMIFFSLVGGVVAFGSLGLVYGPLIVTFVGSMYKFHVSEVELK